MKKSTLYNIMETLKDDNLSKELKEFLLSEAEKEGIDNHPLKEAKVDKVADTEVAIPILETLKEIEENNIKTFYLKDVIKVFESTTETPVEIVDDKDSYFQKLIASTIKDMFLHGKTDSTGELVISVDMPMPTKEHPYYDEMLTEEAEENIVDEISDITSDEIDTIDPTVITEAKKKVKNTPAKIAPYMEDYFASYFTYTNKNGYVCERPVLNEPNGYPDLVIRENGKDVCYVEIKTFTNSMDTFRTFYYSYMHGEKKLKASCPHILIGFKKKSTDEKSSISEFGYKVVSLKDKIVTLKLEMNSDNKSIYFEGNF